MNAEVVDLAAVRRGPQQSMRHDPAAEAEVLVCALFEPACLDEVIDLLVPSDFGDTRARCAWESMVRLHRSGAPIDLSTVRADLVAAGRLGRVTDEYLLTLTERVPMPETVEHHARTVRGYAQTRAIVDAAQRILATASKPVEDPAAFAADAEATMASAARERADAAGPVGIKDAVIESFERLTRAAERVAGGDSPDGAVPSRFKALNRKLGGGFRGGELHLIAGRPGMGKTAIALDLALSLAESGPGIVYELEMSRDELVRRALGSVGQIDGGKIRTATLNRSEWARLTSASGKITNLPLHIDDTPAVTLAHVRATARRQRARDGLTWILIDYLQLMRGEGYSREDQVGSISRGLKALAKELDIPVIALAQLNRDLEKRPAGQRRPQLSDLRDSGSLEQDADTVMFIYREEVYRKDDLSIRGLAELIIGKQRSGPVGTVPLRYLAEYTRFEEMLDEHPAPSDIGPGGTWDPDGYDPEAFRD